jgi:hypothetical protein
MHVNNVGAKYGQYIMANYIWESIIANAEKEDILVSYFAK